MYGKKEIRDYWKRTLEWDENNSFKDYLIYWRENKCNDDAAKTYCEWENEVIEKINTLREDQKKEFRAYLKCRMRFYAHYFEVFIGVGYALIIGLSTGIISKLLFAETESLPSYFICFLGAIVIIYFLIWFALAGTWRPYLRSCYYEDIIEILDKNCT